MTTRFIVALMAIALLPAPVAQTQDAPALLQAYQLGLPTERPAFVFGDEVPEEDRELIRKSIELAMQYVWEEIGTAISDFTVFAFADQQAFLDEFLNQRNVAERHRAEVLEQVRERVELNGDRFGGATYLSPDGFGGATYLSPDGVHSGQQGIFIYGQVYFEDEFQRLGVMAHEYFHVIQNDNVDPADFSGRLDDHLRLIGPIWLHEGSAEYVAQRTLAEVFGEHTFVAYSAAQVAAARKIDLPLQSLETEAAYDLGNVPYTLGFLAVDRLVGTSGGLEALVSFDEAFPGGTTWEDAFQDHFGLSIEAFYDEFEAQRSETFPPVGQGQAVAGTN